MFGPIPKKYSGEISKEVVLEMFKHINKEIHNTFIDKTAEKNKMKFP